MTADRDRSEVDELLDLGCDLADEEQHVRAVECFRRAAELGSDDAWLDLGNSLSALGHHEEAASAYEAAAGRGVAEAWLNLGIAREHLGDPDGAMLAFRAASAAGDPHGTVAVAQDLWSSGESEQAQSLMQRAADTGAVLAIGLLASWRWELTLDVSLESDLRQGASHHPAVRATLGRLLRTSGRFEEARVVLEAGVALGERESMLPLGNLYADDLDDGALAEAAYVRGIETGDLFCHHNLAMLLLDGGDVEGARHHLTLGTAGGDDLARVALDRLDTPDGP